MRKPAPARGFDPGEELLKTPSVKIKQKPEDFSVTESFRFDQAPRGRYGVYLMDKQKLSTFEAVERLRAHLGLPRGAISYCGLKDKQGRTEQLIAIEGNEVSYQDPQLRLKSMGRTALPLSAANTTSNRFSVTVRAVSESDLGQLNRSAAEVARLGVVNYFDSQRFGSLKHGQGFIAKDLIRGDFEAAHRNYMAKPSPLDRSEDAKVKAFWRDHWGEWSRPVPFEGNRKYHRILRALRKDPKNFTAAFLQIDRDYRALILFTYQSYLWNEGVRRLLQLTLPREHLFPHPYQAGVLLFHQDAGAEELQYLRKTAFPLLAPDSTYGDERIRSAAEWALAKQKISLSSLRIEQAPKLLFFKHEERPILIQPQKLVIGRHQPDELNRGLLKLNVAFTLAPGAYATLVIRRLFHFCYREDTPNQILQFPTRPPDGHPERPSRRAQRQPSKWP